MNIKNIAENTYLLSVDIDDILFEGLWEMPNGVALNSYIIKGEKTAIIDGVCGWDGVPENLYALLDELDIDPLSIEYLIINHMEPDHSGWIEDFRKINSNFKIICSEKGKDLLEAFYGNTQEVQCVKDGDTIDLGKGHVLTFAEIPNVHWPDTIATLDTTTGVLFTCDAFGAFGKNEKNKFGDELSEEQMIKFEKEAVRYYSNIVAAFSMQTLRAIDKCEKIPVKMIAPGHGLLWNNPETIINLYKDYASYQKGPARREITIIWGSMYGMTEKAVNHIITLLEEDDIKYNIHRVPEDSWGTVLASAWVSTGIILAMPTYEYKMFPPMAAVLDELGRKKVQGRKAFRIGSYGWSGGAQKELDEIMDRHRMNWEFLEPVEFKGSPKEEDIKLIGEQVKLLINQVKEVVIK